MSEPLNESTFWWVISGTWGAGVAALTGVLVWARGFLDGSAEDRRNLWSEVRAQARLMSEENARALERFATRQDLRNLQIDIKDDLRRQTEELSRIIKSDGRS